MEDKLKLMCCKHFVEGSVKFISTSYEELPSESGKEEDPVLSYFNAKSKREFQVEIQDKDLAFASQIDRFQSYLTNKKQNRTRMIRIPDKPTSKKLIQSHDLRSVSRETETNSRKKVVRNSAGYFNTLDQSSNERGKTLLDNPHLASSPKPNVKSRFLKPNDRKSQYLESNKF